MIIIRQRVQATSDPCRAIIVCKAFVLFEKREGRNSQRIQKGRVMQGGTRAGDRGRIKDVAGLVDPGRMSVCILRGVGKDISKT